MLNISLSVAVAKIGWIVLVCSFQLKILKINVTCSDSHLLSVNVLNMLFYMTVKQINKQCTCINN